jgi:hypothetical protein
MSNYKIIGIDQFDNPFTYFVLFLDCDPMTTMAKGYKC